MGHCMPGLRLVVAESRQQISDAERLRWQVYGEEEGLLPTSANTNGCEIDGRDFADSTTHLLVYAAGEAVGTVRLIRARSAACTSTAAWGLALESSFVLSGFSQPGVVLAEVTRFCVLRRFRGTRVTPALFAALKSESLRRGVTHWVAAANMETDSAEDAALAYQLIQAKNLINPVFGARPRPLPGPPRPARRFVYTPVERLRARRGDVSALRLPRILSLFADKMGARYIGSPAYDPYFNVFAAPLAVELASFAE